MKKYIVVMTDKAPTNEDTTFSLNEGFSTALEWKPLYDQSDNDITFNENFSPRLKELQDEMKRTYTVVVSENDIASLEKLQQEGVIKSFEEDEMNEQYLQPNDPLLASLYGLDKINVAKVWYAGFTGKGILVAVVDSGIDINHPDLVNNLWNDGSNHHGFNMIDGSFDLTDESNHGTHVAGTIGASANNNTGIAGVAYGCTIMAIKALSGPRGRGEASNLANAIKKAADNDAKVINNSWGPGRADEIKKAIEYASLRGCFIVFAAGNLDEEVTANDAAGNPLVVSVSATDENDHKADFSNFGELVTVAAPGVAILSTVPGNDYEKLNGTSMAAPHVSGVAALLLSKNPGASPAKLRTAIINSCDPFGQPPPNPIGAGRVNALKAIKGV